MCESSQSKKNTFSLKNFTIIFPSCVWGWKWDEDKDEKGNDEKKNERGIKNDHKKTFFGCACTYKKCSWQPPLLSDPFILFCLQFQKICVCFKCNDDDNRPDRPKDSTHIKVFFFDFLFLIDFSFYWTILSVCFFFFFFVCFIVFAMHQLSNN